MNSKTPLRGKALRDYIDHIVLKRGAHDPNGEACVMEAVSFVAREPWSDHPECVSPVLGEFLRAWNDGMNDADRQMLKPWVPKLVGTRAPASVERVRAYMAADWSCRVAVPMWLRLIHKDELAAEAEALTPVVDAETAESARAVMRRARDAAAAYDAAAASSAAYEAAAAAAYEAAAAALRPTVERLQASALELLGRMVAAS